jgi:integrase
VCHQRVSVTVFPVHRCWSEGWSCGESNTAPRLTVTSRNALTCMNAEASGARSHPEGAKSAPTCVTVTHACGTLTRMPTPTANVHTDGSVTWRVRFRIGGRHTNPVNRTFTDERKAAWFAGLVDQLGGEEASRILDEQITRGVRTEHTVASWLLYHIDQLTGVTDGTRDRYRRQVATKFHVLGPLPLDAIGTADVEKWVNMLHTKGIDAQPVKGKTIANYHGLLSAALERAVRAGLLDTNPAKGTRIPDDEREEMVFLSAAEFDHLLTHVPARGRDMVELLPITGLRFGEITALQVRDVDLQAGRLTVQRAFKYAEGQAGGVLGAPKSRRSRRTIALGEQAATVLARAMKGKTSTDFVFTNSAGRVWTSPRFHPGIWQPAVRAAMNPELHEAPGGEQPACPHPVLTKRPRVHDMRHTCASWMLAQHVRIDVVSRHLGHESIQVTVDRYGHLDPDALADAASALDRAARGQVAPLRLIKTA